jgi:hypothetical protein
MPTKSARSQHIHYPASSDNFEQSKFPIIRYFQIHFEHMEGQLTENRRKLDEMQNQIAELAALIYSLTNEIAQSKQNE